MNPQDQDFFPLINWTITNLTALASIASAIIFVVFLAYVYTRAGSMHFLRDRIWRLMGGKSDFFIPHLQNLKLEARELEHFRFEFGIPANTISDIEFFEEWIRNHGISLKDAATAKNYINWTDYRNLSVKIKNPNLAKNIFTFFGFTSLAAATLFFLFATPNYLLANFPDSPYFYISHTDTKLSILGKTTITTTTCSEEKTLLRLSQENEFPIKRLKDICNAYGDEKQIALLKKRISEQKIAASILAIFFSFLMIFFGRESAKVSAAQRIKKIVAAGPLNGANREQTTI